MPPLANHISTIQTMQASILDKIVLHVNVGHHDLHIALH